MTPRMRSPEEIARREAIKNSLPNDLNALAEKLSDPDHDVRSLSVAKMMWLDDPKAIQPLIDAFEDDHLEVRRSIALALAHYEPKEAVSALVHHVIDDPSVQVRAICAFALSCIGGDEALDGLRVALKDSDENVRYAACWTFAHHQDKRAVPEIIEMMNDPDWKVRKSACEVLVRLEVADNRIASTLAQLKNEPEYEMFQAEHQAVFDALTNVQRFTDEELSDLEDTPVDELETQAQDLIVKSLIES